MEGFKNKEGNVIVYDLIKTIQNNKQYLSEIDGAIGDGDHGINMNKGFTICEKELSEYPGDMTHCLKTLSRVLMTDIGGSMGPLYGMFFGAMAETSDKNEFIDIEVFKEMLEAGELAVRDIGNAEVGDKTLLDTLVPAVQAFKKEKENGKSFSELLDSLKLAAVKGRDSTKELVAKVGRASRLGERSRGVLDAGATSCCLILESMAESIKKLI